MPRPRRAAVALFGVCFIVGIGLYGGSFKTISPNSMGIELNSLSSKIAEDKVYTAGRYFLGVGKSFVVYPSTYITLDIDRIEAATKEKQSVELNISLQYRLQPRALVALYKEWQENYETFFASETIQRIKQQTVKFDMTEFYTNRAVIRLAIEEDLRAFFGSHLAELGFFELLQIDFTVDDAILQKFVTSQATKTAAIQQTADVVRKKTDELVSQLTALVTVRKAQADAEGIEILADAAAAGFTKKTLASAESIARLADELNLSGDQLLKYLWLQTMAENANSNKSKLLVGFEGVLKDLLANSGV